MVLGTNADPIAVVEAAYRFDVDESRWAWGVVDAYRGLLARPAPAAFLAIAHRDGYRDAELLVCEGDPEICDSAATLHPLLTPGVVREVWYPGLLAATRSELRRQSANARAIEGFTRQAVGAPDAVGVLASPRPGVATTLLGLLDREESLDRRERALLSRLSAHVGAALRLRWQPETSVAAVVSPDGRVLELTDPALEPHRPFLVDRVIAVERARGRRSRGAVDAVDAWKALIAGRLSVAPREDADGRRCYLLLHNPPEAQPSTRLSASEVDMLLLSARGCPGKVVAYTLGVSQSHVSTSMARAARKLGLASRTELVRIAAALSTGGPSEPTAPLTAAERDILALLVRGLSNAQIAALRGRAVTTVAKQVSSILAKTHSTGRRAAARIRAE